MTTSRNPKPRHLTAKLPHAAAFLTLLVSSLALVGWQFDIQAFKSLRNGLTAMNPMAAVVFLIAGLSLWLQTPETRPNATRRIGKALGWVVLFVGALRLGGIVFGWNLGLDQILFHEKMQQIGAGLPRSISPNGAMSFALFGIALLLLDIDWDGRYPAQFLAMASSVIPLLALVGYAYGARSFYGLASYKPLSVNGAIGFLAFSIGLFFARPESGLAPLFSSDTAGGIVVRRLLTIAIGLPILLGWLRVVGQEAGMYGTDFGTALEAVTYIGVFATIVYWTGRLLHQSDLRRALAEESLQKRTDELELANKELESFSYSVSHDLRAPLRSIDGFSAALEEDYSNRLDDAGMDQLRRVRMAAHKMSGLIDDLLNLSRVARTDIHRDELDLSQMAKSIAEELRKADASRRVDFVIENDLRARGDTRLLRIAMENLMRNAWKYTSKHESARIEVGRSGENGHSTFFIRDDGAGFDAKNKDRLFGAFQRLHRAADFPGTGVGLATVQRVIHRHGGRVWAEGAVEQGATFYFTLN